MSDKTARAEAQKIREEFWENFDKALAPKQCSKQTYLDELEELAADLEGRADAVREELANED